MTLQDDVVTLMKAADVIRRRAPAPMPMSTKFVMKLLTRLSARLEKMAEEAG